MSFIVLWGGVLLSGARYLRLDHVITAESTESGRFMASVDHADSDPTFVACALTVSAEYPGRVYRLPQASN